MGGVGDDVYKGMIIGINQRPGDLEVNICKTKQLNNMRAATKDKNAGIITPVDMSLDACVEYLAVDEILEVTPSLFRMSKNPAMAGKSPRNKLSLHQKKQSGHAHLCHKQKRQI